MTNMIKADLYRTVKHFALYIAIGIMLLMIGMSVYIMSAGRLGINIGVNENNAGIVDAATSGKITTISQLREWMKSQPGYPLDQDILSMNANLYYVFLFVVAVVIAVDFTAGCTKNTLSSATGRGKYFLSKVMTVGLICTVLFFANTYITYFANLIFNGKNLSSGLWEVTKITLLQLPALLMLISIPVGIAFMVKKTAVYNLVTIPLLMILDLVFQYGVPLFHIPQKVLRYTPEAIFSNLANHPDTKYMIISFMVCAVVSAVFLAAGYLTFKKSEIK